MAAVTTGTTIVWVSESSQTALTSSAVTPTSSHAITPRLRSQCGAANMPESSAASISTNSVPPFACSPSAPSRRNRPCSVGLSLRMAT